MRKRTTDGSRSVSVVDMAYTSDVKTTSLLQKMVVQPFHKVVDASRELKSKTLKKPTNKLRKKRVKRSQTQSSPPQIDRELDQTRQCTPVSRHTTQPERECSSPTSINERQNEDGDQTRLRATSSLPLVLHPTMSQAARTHSGVLYNASIVARVHQPTSTQIVEFTDSLIRGYGRQLKKMKADHAASIANLRRDHESTIAKQEYEIRELEKDVLHEEETYNSLQFSNECLQDDFASLKSNFEKLEKERDGLEEQVGALSDRIENLRKTDPLHDELENAKAELKSKTATIQLLQHTIKSATAMLTAESSSWPAHYQKLLEGYDQLFYDYELLDSEVDHMAEQHRAVIDEHFMKSQAGRVMEANKDLQRFIDLAKPKLDQNDAVIRQMATDINKLERENAVQKVEINELHNRPAIGPLQQEIQSLSEKLDECEARRKADIAELIQMYSTQEALHATHDVGNDATPKQADFQRRNPSRESNDTTLVEKSDEDTPKLYSPSKLQERIIEVQTMFTHKSELSSRPPLSEFNSPSKPLPLFKDGKGKSVAADIVPPPQQPIFAFSTVMHSSIYTSHHCSQGLPYSNTFGSAEAPPPASTLPSAPVFAIPQPTVSCRFTEENSGQPPRSNTFSNTDYFANFSATRGQVESLNFDFNFNFNSGAEEPVVFGGNTPARSERDETYDAFAKEEETKETTEANNVETLPTDETDETHDLKPQPASSPQIIHTEAFAPPTALFAEPLTALFHPHPEIHTQDTLRLADPILLTRTPNVPQPPSPATPGSLYDSSSSITSSELNNLHTGPFTASRGLAGGIPYGGCDFGPIPTGLDVGGPRGTFAVEDEDAWIDDDGDDEDTEDVEDGDMYYETKIITNDGGIQAGPAGQFLFPNTYPSASVGQQQPMMMLGRYAVIKPLSAATATTGDAGAAVQDFEVMDCDEIEGDMKEEIENGGDRESADAEKRASLDKDSDKENVEMGGKKIVGEDSAVPDRLKRRAAAAKVGGVRRKGNGRGRKGGA